jgi:copper homeostasis protein
MDTSFYHSSAITDGTETADGEEVKALVAHLK